MSIDMLIPFFGWCAVINLGLLLWWFLCLLFFRDWVFSLHTRWFNLSQERFDVIHYSGIALYKMSIFFFNIVPYLALRIIS